MLSPGLLLRDKVAQPVADLIVRYTPIGPFHVSAYLIRIGAVLMAASAASRIIANHEPGAWLGPAMGGAAGLLLTLWWLPEVERGVRRPPRGGLPSATRFHGELIFLSMMPIFLGLDVADLIGSFDIPSFLDHTGGALLDCGYVIGAALWRDLPRSERRSLSPAFSAT